MDTVSDSSGRFCSVPVTHKVTLGRIVDLIEEYRNQSVTLLMAEMPEGSFEKKLFPLNLRYLPVSKFKSEDEHGRARILYRACPHPLLRSDIRQYLEGGVTKGQPRHNPKRKMSIVVHGRALIRERNINTGETVEFEVSSDRIEAVYMIPGWTGSIINLIHTDDLVTVMTCNEVFNPSRSDTFFLPV